jgi:ribosomal protein S27E
MFANAIYSIRRRTDCEPFKRYLVITCEKCGHKQALFRDPVEGKGTNQSHV